MIKEARLVERIHLGAWSLCCNLPIHEVFHFPGGVPYHSTNPYHILLPRP